MQKLKERAQNRSRGFTIIELLVVIVIIGILVGLLLPNLFESQQRARDTERKNDLSTIQTQLETFHNDNQAYPADLSELTPDYMDEIPQDPESGSYTYDATAGGSDCTTAASCDSYQLVADLENNNDPDATSYGGSSGFYVIDSVNQ